VTREEEKEKQVKQLQQEYAKHTVTDDEKEQARQRFLQRQQAKREAKLQQGQAQ